MRLAFFLDNRGIAGRGPLPDPSQGNPGLGGTEYAFLAVVALLNAAPQPPLQARLFLTAPQRLEGLDPSLVTTVADLAEALQHAQVWGAVALVFRPGALTPEQWAALETTCTPLVAWFHNLGCAQQARTEALPMLRRWVLVSGAQLDHFRHSRLAHQAVVIPNPVAVPVAFSQPRAWPDAEQASDLAYVGALTPFKGFDRLAARWGAIASACPETRLRVFGGADLYGPALGEGRLGPFELYCRKLLERSGYAQRVIFEGTCGLERYAAYRSVAVGVVNPSGCDETFCLSAAEFSACGIPVITARRHALPQTVLDRQTGLLAGSDAELAAHCIRLLRDPHQAWSLGQAGQAHVAESFGPDRIRSGWYALASALHQNITTPPAQPSTPWNHEQRWLRQLWGAMLMLPGWPSWPVVKARIKQLLQGGEHAIGPVGVGLLAGALALLIWVLVVFGKYGGNPSGLARIGDQMQPSPRLQGQELVILRGKRGNDGQQFLALALDPLQQDAGTSRAVDNPIYRGKRLLYPALAWMFGFGRPGLVVWTLGLVNVVCIGFAAGLVARWAESQQRSARWGLAVLALPAYWITLSLDTSDLLATTLMLSTAVSWQQGRLRSSCLALGSALLTRETELLAWVASLLDGLWVRRWRAVGALGLVLLPWLVWTMSLRWRFPNVHDGALARLHFTWPGAGILYKSLSLLGFLPLSTGGSMGPEHLFDGLCFLLWLASLLVLLVGAFQSQAGRWLRLLSALLLLPALCTSLQILARFPDYTRVWIDVSSVALLLLLAQRNRWLSMWVASSALVSLGYAIGYWSAA